VAPPDFFFFPEFPRRSALFSHPLFLSRRSFPLVSALRICFSFFCYGVLLLCELFGFQSTFPLLSLPPSREFTADGDPCLFRLKAPSFLPDRSGAIFFSVASSSTPFFLWSFRSQVSLGPQESVLASGCPLFTATRFSLSGFPSNTFRLRPFS